MRSMIIITVWSLLFTHAVAAQVAPVVSPVAGTPKIKIPVTIAGKTKLVDSLKKTNFSTAQIIKTLIPKYVSRFQQDMIEGLTLLYKAGYSTAHLGQIVKDQYPEIKYSLATKLFYAAKKEYTAAIPNEWYWPLELAGELYEIYYCWRNKPKWPEHDGWWQLAITNLEEAGDSLSTIFSYIKIYDLYLQKNYPEDVISEIEYYSFGFRTTNFPDSAILKKIVELKGERDDILTQYIRGVSNYSIARIIKSLKTLHLSKERIRTLLIKAEGYFFNEIDAALENY